MKEFWIIFTSLFILCSECFCAYNHSFALNQRTKRQFDCDGFKCKRGRQECIDSEKMCDGIVDCQDGSDESNDLCSKIHCPEDLFFQCAYGACIDLEKKCNGKKDCKDNSDEENCIIIDKDKQKCSQEEFECDNGLCIEVEGKCNGVVECSDGSDETERTCLNTYCPEVYFKCAYGACVDGNAKCNGIKDCYDNSDERPTLCNQQNPVTFAPTTGRVCETPANPEHGTWRYYFNGSPYYPRTQVGIDTTIQLSCDEGWLPSITDEDNTKIMICKESGWTVRSNIVCQRKCPEIYNTANMNVTCRKNSGLIIPCNKATTGTTLTLKCKPYYESRSHSYVRRCQANGEWNKEIGNGECIPACGEKKVQNPMEKNHTTEDYYLKMILIELSKLNSKITELTLLEEMDSKVIVSLQNKVKLLEKENQILKDRINVLSNINTFEDLAVEAKERLKREKRLIIFGLPEANQDANDVKDILQHILPEISLVPRKIVRVGNINKSPRPLRLLFAGTNDTKMVLKHKSAITSHARFYNIDIQPNLTKLQEKTIISN